ncbi:MAG TPA: glycosyltransferase [Aquihabitans sp.]|nr:glycosyltransferase [Aquihabitans sp.]
MSGCTATVLLPTTGDRGPLLRHSVASVLAQTVADLELFVVGDGVSPGTRAVVEELATTDARVRFVDLPKHHRRGEPHRHQVLGERAGGRVVAYLCDRDLWLPTHLEELVGVLDGGADLAHTLRFDVTDTGGFRFRHVADLTDPTVRARHASIPNLLPLSFVGHTLDAYRRLPHGWRTTPAGTATDRYMWAQFLDQPWTTVASSPMPTVLYFKRGHHPGLSTPERLRLLEAWSPRATSIERAGGVERDVLTALWQTWAELEVSERRRRSRPWRRAPRVLRARLGGR